MQILKLLGYKGFYIYTLSINPTAGQRKSCKLPDLNPRL